MPTHQVMMISREMGIGVVWMKKEGGIGCESRLFFFFFFFFLGEEGVARLRVEATSHPKSLEQFEDEELEEPASELGEPERGFE